MLGCSSRVSDVTRVRGGDEARRVLPGAPDSPGGLGAESEARRVANSSPQDALHRGLLGPGPGGKFTGKSDGAVEPTGAAGRCRHGPLRLAHGSDPRSSGHKTNFCHLDHVPE